jgi:calcineurin-like phosphoesterase family protein
MKTWLCADWHLGEDRMNLMQRPWDTTEEMVGDLIKWHNSVVAPDDEVIVVGDAVYKNAPLYLPLVGFF